MRLLSFACCLGFLASCTLGPTHLERTTAQGDRTVITTAGVTILTRNAFETTSITKGDFTAEHTVTEKDEVAVPRYGAWKAVGTAGANALGDVTDTIVDGVTNN
jgi:hypothetical protein